MARENNVNPAQDVSYVAVSGSFGLAMLQTAAEILATPANGHNEHYLVEKIGPLAMLLMRRGPERDRLRKMREALGKYEVLARLTKFSEKGSFATLILEAAKLNCRQDVVRRHYPGPAFAGNHRRG